MVLSPPPAHVGIRLGWVLRTTNLIPFDSRESGVGQHSGNFSRPMSIRLKNGIGASSISDELVDYLGFECGGNNLQVAVFAAKRLPFAITLR